MTGVGEPYALRTFPSGAGLATWNSLRSWTILPLPLSTQTAPSSRPSALAVLTHTCSPQTTGDDHALPWTAVFQATFSVSLQVTGRSLASERPCIVGPRKAGQFSSASAEPTARSNPARKQVVRRLVIVMKIPAVDAPVQSSGR